MIIVLEGIDGSGKTTLSQWLQGALYDRGRLARLCRDPGGTPAGERLRAIVKDATVPMHPLAQMLAFSAARVQLAEQIRPWDAAGEIVILDRWWFSTYAYQAAQGVDPELIEEIAQKTAKVPLNPDLCFWFDVDPPEAVRRSTAGRDEVPPGVDRFDTRGLEFRKELRKHYEFLWDRRHLLTRIDANADISVVWARLWAAVCAKLSLE